MISEEPVCVEQAATDTKDAKNLTWDITDEIDGVLQNRTKVQFSEAGPEADCEVVDTPQNFQATLEAWRPMIAKFIPHPDQQEYFMKLPIAPEQRGDLINRLIAHNAGKPEKRRAR